MLKIDNTVTTVNSGACGGHILHEYYEPLPDRANLGQKLNARTKRFTEFYFRPSKAQDNIDL